MVKKYILHSASNSTPSSAVDFQKELNPSQWEVVRSADGPCLVLAGAGSGKTRTLVYRMLYLLEKGIAPESLVLVTFTNKAAFEMKHRLESLLNRTASGLWCGTFHHMAHRILRAWAPTVGFTAQFGILDAEDSTDLVKSCYSALPFKAADEHFPQASLAHRIISLARNCQKPIADIVSKSYPYFENFIQDLELIAREYDTRKLRTDHMDFDDLLILWLRLFRENAEFKKRYTELFRYVLVDEFQDTNKLQNDIVLEAACHHRNLLVVGDDAQSIYSFRGARVDNILEFPSHFEDTRIFRLETNYRSTPQILAVANASIRHNTKQFPKTLTGHRERGPLPEYVRVRDVHDQSLFVSQRILELVSEGVDLHRIAVLFRARYQAAELELELSRRKVPYVLRGGVRFFEQAHIKDVLSYLRIIRNPKDELAWMRALTLEAGLGARLTGQIFKAFSESGASLGDTVKPEFARHLPARAQKPFGGFQKKLSVLLAQADRAPDVLIDRVLQSGYIRHLQAKYDNAQDRIEDLEELARFAHTYKDLESFLGDVALRENFKGETLESDAEKSAEPPLVLSTIHQAKGLEWKAVFILSLSEGHFPHHHMVESREDLEEERRLFYVAVTRAQDELYLIHPMSRADYQRGSILSRPSPFVEEIPTHLLEQPDVETQAESTRADSWEIDVDDEDTILLDD